MTPRGTVRGRFGGFAAGHLAVSLLGAALIFLLPGGALDGAPGLAALTAGLMLLYPGLVTDIIGLVLIVALTVLLHGMRKKRQAAAA